MAFDCETTTDHAQRLTFGWYRYARWQPDGTLATVEEGIFHADDLAERDPDGYARLKAYTSTHAADLGFKRRGSIKLRSRREFLDEVLWTAIEAEAHIVGFNLPFDLSRLAVGWGGTRRGRKRKKGGMPPANVYSRGFSLVLWEYWNKAIGEWREDPFRPHVRIKQVDRKRAFIGLASPLQRGPRVPRPQGRFLDLKTLAFAVTNRGHSLASACDAFGIVEGKAVTEQHGIITEEYIDYARQDVRAYLHLLERLRVAFDQHPIDLLPERAQSPASIAKAYIRAMEIPPLLERDPALSPSMLGKTMSAFYGGRTECRIRRVPVPVVYVDFLAMYMSINGLLSVWQFITAERVEFVDATAEVQALLDRMKKDQCFDPSLWPQLMFYAQIVPDGDLLPVRGEYDDASFTIGLNPLTADRPLWYAGPDLVDSKLLTGKPPRVLRAFRLVPHGTLSTLRPVKLGGVVPIDPRTDDFFRFVIEERKRVKHAKANGEPVPAHLDLFLKVLANSGGYGIFAELNRQEFPVEEKIDVTIFSAGDEPFSARTNTPEVPGKTCYPPIAALITSAARLMLGLLEREVTDRGGSYAFCDIDSMAIVANEHGGLVPYPGGPHRLPNGQAAIHALAWKDVDAIVERFAALNPYDRSVVPDSVLEVEDVNVDPETKARRQLWCYAISAKRYALFTHDAKGAPVVVDDGFSKHGLGHVLNPSDPDSEDQEWIRTMWQGFICDALGHPFIWPSWLERPAMSRILASSPHVLRSLTKSYRGSYNDAPKPFNFLVSPYVAPLGHPIGVDSQRFHLIAPYTPDARQWTKMRWTDVYSGEIFGITTGDAMWADRTARVQSYGEVIAQYQTHPEAKSLGPDGKPCNRRTVGLLQRRPVVLGELVHIGKETNRLEEVEQGMIHDWDEVQLVFREPWDGSTASTARHETPSGVQRRCQSCGTTLGNTCKTYCSPACRQRAYRQRKRHI